MRIDHSLTQPQQLIELRLQLRNNSRRNRHSAILPILAEDTSSLAEEWTTNIILRKPNNLALLMSNNPMSQFSVLRESEARFQIECYSDGCFLIFQKNDTYFLLAKVESETKQFTIVAKTDKKTLKTVFNLKDSDEQLIFDSAGIPAHSLHHFLRSPELRAKFPVWLPDIGLFSHHPLDDLKKQVLGPLFFHSSGYPWLPHLPERLQHDLLFIFLKTFISNLYLYKDIPSLIEGALYRNDGWIPAYREHYSLERIQKNLEYLAELSKNGISDAAMLLAIFARSGFCKHKPDSYGSFFLPAELQNEVPILRDLEVYREITQNSMYFKDKIVRDIFLLRYFEINNDKKNMNAQLQQIDLNQAIYLREEFCSDFIISACIALNEKERIGQLTEQNNIVHHLIDCDRTITADQIKDKLPNHVFEEKDEMGRTILIVLVDYLCTHGIRGSRSVLELFKFICNLFPEMLDVADNQGHTVYDSIERFKQEHSIEWCRNTIVELETCIEQCHVGPMSLRNSY